MSLIRLLARPLLAAPIVVGGVDAIRHPGSTSEVSERAAQGLTSRVPQLQSLGPDAAVKLNGGIMTASGVLLAMGRLPRVASLAMAATLIPPVIERAREYKANPKDADPATRAEQRKDLLRSAGVLGGVLLAAVDTAGRPSLSRRARSATTHVGTVAAASTQLARRELKHAAREAKLAGRLATKSAAARLP